MVVSENWWLVVMRCGRKMAGEPSQLVPGVVSADGGCESTPMRQLSPTVSPGLSTALLPMKVRPPTVTGASVNCPASKRGAPRLVESAKKEPSPAVKRSWVRLCDVETSARRPIFAPSRRNQGMR